MFPSKRRKRRENVINLLLNSVIAKPCVVRHQLIDNSDGRTLEDNAYTQEHNWAGVECLRARKGDAITQWPRKGCVMQNRLAIRTGGVDNRVKTNDCYLTTL